MNTLGAIDMRNVFTPTLVNYLHQSDLLHFEN